MAVRLCVRCALAACLLGGVGGCSGNETGNDAERTDERQARYARQRHSMIKQLQTYGIRDEGVLNAMSIVRRHAYIPQEFRDRVDAYGDHPCPIGHGQTISQPYIVAYMTEHLQVRKAEKVLEIGTGSGYQAAVLAELGADVYSIEIVPELGAHARRALASEGYERVHLRVGDGYQGWPEHAPFDAIIVTCAPEDVPEALTDQLDEGGRMIIPVGEKTQRLVTLRKEEGKITRVNDLPVRFVPMVHGERE